MNKLLYPLLFITTTVFGQINPKLADSLLARSQRIESEITHQSALMNSTYTKIESMSSKYDSTNNYLKSISSTIITDKKKENSPWKDYGIPLLVVFIGAYLALKNIRKTVIYNARIKLIDELKINISDLIAQVYKLDRKFINLFESSEIIDLKNNVDNIKENLDKILHPFFTKMIDDEYYKIEYLQNCISLSFLEKSKDKDELQKQIEHLIKKLMDENRLTLILEDVLTGKINNSTYKERITLETFVNKIEEISKSIMKREWNEVRGEKCKFLKCIRKC